MIFRSAPIYPAETPLRRVCNVFRMNFLSRLLRDVKGVGCKIDKKWTRGGYGWRIIVDGKSTDELLPDGSSPFDYNGNLDHSFRPTQLTATTAQVTPGTIYDRFGTGRSVSTATDWPVDGVINFASSKRFYVQIRYLSSPPESIGQFDAMQWVPTAGAFPDFRPSEFTENIPIMEFPSNTWASLIRRQTSGAYLNAYRHNSLVNLQGGTAPNEYYHLTAAQVELIDTHLPPAYPPQDPGQPWPTPGDHAALDNLEWIAGEHIGTGTEEDELDDIQIAGFDVDGTAIYVTGSGIGELVNHSQLADIAGGTAGDDHVNEERGGIEGSANVSYLNLDGDETRNAMPEGAGIGDGSGNMTIKPHERQLTFGFWQVKDTTAAGVGTGALVVDGGIAAAKGVSATKGTATWSGYFASSGTAALLDGTVAGRFYSTLTDGVDLSDGTYAVNAGDTDGGKINAGHSYLVNGAKVVGAQGAAVADATGAGDVVAQLNSLLAKLRTHGLIAT